MIQLRSPGRIILASVSPRRKHLLRQIGLDFETRESSVVEYIDPTKSPEENVKRLAELKARDVGATVEEGIIVGADTIVVLDGKILGKPKNSQDAESMLRALSGREHTVFTGFAIYQQPGGTLITDFESTRVRFRELEDEEIRSYVRSGSPLDKAGAYGIQDDFGAVFVERIEGCYYTVVGFPLAKFYQRLKQLLPSIV